MKEKFLTTSWQEVGGKEKERRDKKSEWAKRGEERREEGREREEREGKKRKEERAELGQDIYFKDNSKAPTSTFISLPNSLI